MKDGPGIYLYLYFFFKHSYFHGLVRLKQFWGKKNLNFGNHLKKKVYSFFSTKKRKKKEKRNEKYLSGVKVHQMLQVEFDEQGKSRNKFNVFLWYDFFFVFFKDKTGEITGNFHYVITILITYFEMHSLIYIGYVPLH